MELRQLRYFAAVAEELHFTRAAERLDVAQPALSRQIRQLERELNVELFTRTTRAVVLTDAGRVLAEEATGVLESADRVAVAARSSADGHTAVLRIASSGGALGTIVPDLIRAFRRRAPQTAVDLRALGSGAQLDALRAGDIDVGIVGGPLSAHDIALQVIVHERYVAAVPAEHPLADRDQIPLAALADEPFVLFPRARAQARHDDIVAHCQRVGFTPLIATEASDIATVVALVASGIGVSLVPQSADAYPHRGAALLPLAPPAPSTATMLAWRRGDATPAVELLRSLALTFS